MARMGLSKQFIKVLWHLIGAKKLGNKRPSLSDLFQTKWVEINKYRVLKSTRFRADLWLAPMDRAPGTMVRLKAGQIILVREDTRSEMLDVEYKTPRGFKVASVKRDIFEAIPESQLHILPPERLFGGLGNNVNDITNFYRLRKKYGK